MAECAVHAEACASMRVSSSCAAKTARPCLLFMEQHFQNLDIPKECFLQMSDPARAAVFSTYGSKVRILLVRTHDSPPCQRGSPALQWSGLPGEAGFAPSQQIAQGGRWLSEQCPALPSLRSSSLQQIMTCLSGQIGRFSNRQSSEWRQHMPPQRPFQGKPGSKQAHVEDAQRFQGWTANKKQRTSSYKL